LRAITARARKLSGRDVPIGRLFEHFSSADGSHGARLVLDDQVPAFAVRERGSNDARENVGRRARRERRSGSGSKGMLAADLPKK